MRHFLRKIILKILRFFYFFARPLLSETGAAILMYHSVSDSQWPLAVKPADFERQMNYLSKNCWVLRLADLVRFLKNREKIPRRAAVITFDDGYEDFLQNALPILKKYNLPVSIFLLTGTADRKELGNNFPLIPTRDFKNLAEEKLIKVGSHGLTHGKLTCLDEKAVQNEIRESGVIIERKIGHFPDFFAYPKGSFNEKIAQTAREAGYQGAVTTRQRLADKKSYVFALPRIQVDNSTGFSEFKIKLTRAANWYDTIWHLFRFTEYR